MRLLLVAFLLLGTTHEALAASEKYCARYATAIAATIAIINSIVDDVPPDEDADKHAVARAFSTCLNQDEDPRLPFFMGVTEFPPGSVAATGPVTPESNEAPAPTAGAGKDPKWLAWCRKHFPKSFDPDTGMVRTWTRKKWKEISCPYPG